jgi:hypothetical protein
METKFKTHCAGCYREIKIGESVTGTKIGGYWSFLCADCTAKINAEGSSA